MKGLRDYSWSQREQNTHRGDHAVVLLVSSTAAEETDDGHSDSNDDQENWCGGDGAIANLDEVAIVHFDDSTNDDEGQTTELKQHNQYSWAQERLKCSGWWNSSHGKMISD